MSDLVTFEKQGSVGVITVNNPPVNALSQAVRQGLLDGIAKGLADPGVSAMVIIGGGRTFIAGADIREFGKPPQPPDLHSVLAAIEGSGKPVVAAIHGTALGGGLEVCLACHYRVAVAAGQVGLPEVKLGLLPGWGGTQRALAILGRGWARRLVFTGEPVTGEMAAKIGLADEAVPAGELIAAAEAIAQKILTSGPTAVRFAKRAICASESAALEIGLFAESVAFGDIFGGKEAREGLKAFLEKRKPEWTKG